MYLEKVNGPQDIKGFSAEQRKVLAQEMRDAMLKRASIHGGHFGPDFGVVELTIALHSAFHSPRDKFVFDISHQEFDHQHRYHERNRTACQQDCPFHASERHSLKQVFRNL